MSKSRRNFALAKRKRGASEPHCRPLSETKNKYIEILTIDQASSTRRVKNKSPSNLKTGFIANALWLGQLKIKKQKRYPKDINNEEFDPGSG